MRKGSKTDWDRLAKTEDKATDTSDIPELNDEFFHTAKIKTPLTNRQQSSCMLMFYPGSSSKGDS